jgi:hypothetical protein
MKMLDFIIVCSLLLPSCIQVDLTPEIITESGQRQEQKQDQEKEHVRDTIDATDTTRDFYWARSEGVRNVLRRASQMSTIQWTPLNNVPWNSGVFLPGTIIVGIPYSSTKQINKYVGLDVSFHTFMTAVHNPRSVMYTENLSMSPYNGVNCATYYGTVCSTCVDYALGIDIPYPSKCFPDHPDFDEVMLTDLGQLEPGDVLYRPGHVFMIYRVAMSSGGAPISITKYEAGSKICCLETVSATNFAERLNSEGLRVFRYRKIDDVTEYSPSEYIPVGNEPAVIVRYNDVLCPNHGDHSVYRVDEPVIINSFDSSFTNLIIEGDDYSRSIPREDDMEIRGLPPGSYVAYLVSDDSRSDSVAFIVADPHVEIQKSGRLHIVFSCAQGTPHFCVLCDEVGSFKNIIDFSEEDVDRGFVDVDYPDLAMYYCKVVFQTPFGTVINNPIPISK